MLAEAGFTEATFHGWTGYRTSSCTQGGLVTARKPLIAPCHEVRCSGGPAPPAPNLFDPAAVFH